MNIQILIQNGNNIYEPKVKEGIEWVTERKGVPGKLTFEVLQNKELNIQEGNAVKFTLDKKNVFYGYIFKKERSKDNSISITCYDQLRYLKNKDTYCYKGKTASQVLKMICSDFNLKTGNIIDTSYKITQKIEENKSLFDIIQNALDDTLLNRKKLYILYDDFGKITLKDIESMKVNLLVYNDTARNFNYTSSIDEQTYNKIKLVYDNKDKGKRDVYIAKDSLNINKWGILQYYDTLKDGENGKIKADSLLNLYNQKTRNLTLKDVWGDIKVRAGTSLIVQLNLDDIKISNYMMCEKVTHKFNNNEHIMDLKLVGGEFIT